MFTGYFDESGTHGGSKAIVVSGYVASDDQWLQFDKAWKEALADEGLTHFHMKDFVHSKKEFEAWKGDEGRRRGFIERLIKIIRKNTRKSFSTAVILEAYREINSKYLFQEYFGTPYAFCSRMCIVGLDHWRDQHHYQDPVDVVFEDGATDKRTFLALLKRDSFSIPTFAKKREYTPLEAADFVAWEHLKIYNHKETAGTIGRLRNSFLALNSMPHEWGVYTKTNLAKMRSLFNVPERV